MIRLLIALQNPLFLSNACNPLWEKLLEIRFSSERMKNLFKGYGGVGIVSLLYLIPYNNEVVKRYYRLERPQAFRLRSLSSPRVVPIFPASTIV